MSKPRVLTDENERRGMGSRVVLYNDYKQELLIAVKSENEGKFIVTLDSYTGQDSAVTGYQEITGDELFRRIKKYSTK